MPMNSGNARAVSRLQTLPPAYFALVMATGIVSITSLLHGLDGLARGLFALNLAQYAILWGLLILRFARFRANVVADLGDHLRGPGFFTIVAATGVLSAQCFLVAHWPAVGTGLAFFTMLLWMLFVYAVFALLIIKPRKPAFEKGINGGWLVAIVATQSVALSATLAGTHLGGTEPMLLIVGLLAWSFGVMFYIWVISLIFYRYMFFGFEPGDLSPPYWINMGAVAISTLAGCRLIGVAGGHPLLDELQPFIKGIVMILWSTATWWIPMLLILGFWRHVVRAFPFKYDPLYWGMVFPVGMYSACTRLLARELKLPFVSPIAWVFLALGIGVWAIVFYGMLRDIGPVVRSVLRGAALAPSAVEGDKG